ncbi:MAG: sensor histidine kinase [Chloroflexota bacterium]
MNQQWIMWWVDSTAKRDLIVITCIGFICFFAAQYVNAFEWLYDATRPYEEWEFDFDEVVVVGFILSNAFAVFAYRRWRELAREIQERIRIQNELQSTHAQLQEATAQRHALEKRRFAEEQEAVQREATLTATMTERARLARELHDTLAQGFVGVAFQLEGVATLMVETPTTARQQLDLAIRMVRNSVEEARRAIWDMHPQVFEHGSITTALSEIAEQLPTDIAVRVEVHGCTQELPQSVEHHLLRIAHEALYNAARHADASHIGVELEFTLDHVHLSVWDNGRGFDPYNVPSSKQGCFGLSGMHERAKELGTQLEVASAFGEGTSVDVSIVLEQIGQMPHPG